MFSQVSALAASLLLGRLLGGPLRGGGGRVLGGGLSCHLLPVALQRHHALDEEPDEDRQAADHRQGRPRQVGTGDGPLDGIEVHHDGPDHGGEQPAEAPQGHPEDVDPGRVHEHQPGRRVADAREEQPVLGEVADLAEVPDEGEAQQNQRVHGGVQHALAAQLRDPREQQEHRAAEPDPGQAVLDDGDVDGLPIARAADRALDVVVQLLDTASLRRPLEVAARKEQHPETDHHEDHSDDGDNQGSAAPLLGGNRGPRNGHNRPPLFSGTRM